MKRAIATLSALLLGVSLAAAEPWVFEESPPLDGVVEFTEKLESGTNCRHFINASHIIQVSLGSPASKPYSSIDITTSAIMPVRERGTASTNVTHHLRFKTEEEAEKVLRKILAEMSSAPGTGGLTGDDPGGKDTAKDVAPPVVRSIESEEIQAARASFEAIKRRYRYKHPDYQQALLKVLELEMKVQKQK